jgi:hypothetical protein
LVTLEERLAFMVSEPSSNGGTMSSRLSRILALTGVSAVLAVGGAGIAQASPDHSGSKNDRHCKKLHGKKKRECERKHHHRR